MAFYTIFIFFKNYIYYKVRNEKFLALIYVIDVLYTFNNFLLFPLGSTILIIEKEFNIYKLFIILVCLLLCLLGIYKFYLIIKKIVNFKIKIRKDIIIIFFIDLLWILSYLILIFCDDRLQ